MYLGENNNKNNNIKNINNMNSDKLRTISISYQRERGNNLIN